MKLFKTVFLREIHWSVFILQSLELITAVLEVTLKNFLRLRRLKLIFILRTLLLSLFLPFKKVLHVLLVEFAWGACLRVEV
jgi:hypothetical protein